MVQPAAGLVNPVGTLVFRDLQVGDFREELGKHDLVGERAAEGKRVADHRPLGSPKQHSNLPRVMDERGEH